LKDFLQSALPKPLIIEDEESPETLSKSGTGAV